MNYVVIDIETVENDRAKELFAKTKYEPDARLKDPAKIEQSIMEKRQRDMDKAALHWWTGRVICICANVVHQGHKPRPELYPPLTLSGDDEKALLTTFFAKLWHLQDALGSLQVIGKSGDYFDIPFLVGRALVHDLGVPEAIRRVSVHSLRDVDHIFSFSSQCDQRSNLSNYAFGLGIKGKTGHGSQVAGLYSQIVMGDADKWNDIRSYCAQDTDIATEILKRWLKPFIPADAKLAPPPTEPELEIPFGPKETA